MSSRLLAWGRHDRRSQPRPSLPWSGPPKDVAICALLIAIGIPGILLVPRCDFWFDDVAYLQRGLSLLHSHFYGLAGLSERVQPPGYPIMLGLVAALVGSSRQILQSATAVLGTLALVVTYALLRPLEGRRLAAAACVLLGSSLHFFRISTRIVSPTLAYMLFAALVLLAAGKADATKARGSRLRWSIVMALSLAVALLVHSTGVALLVALIGWLAASPTSGRPQLRRRLLTFVPVLLVGLAVEAWWIRQAPAVSDWPLPGYPASYISQLELKSGNFPELGVASAADVVERVARNVHDHAAMLTEVIGHQPLAVSWSSPIMAGMILLVLLGVFDSFLRTGGRLLDFYFVSFETMYLLWPWSFEDRFFLPAAAFAVVYAWRGAQATWRLAARKPRLVGAAALVASLPLGAHDVLWAVAQRGHAMLLGGVPAGLSAISWIVIAALSAWMLWSGRALSALWSGSSVGGFLRVRRLEVAAVAVIVLIGLAQQLVQGRRNLHFAVDQSDRPDVAAARWIGTHTQPGALVLARQVPIVSYYSHRRVAWFPPISRADVLYQGIEQRHARYVLVVDRDDPYYLPDDEHCFAPLLRAHPDAFRLDVKGKGFSVYEVTR